MEEGSLYPSSAPVVKAVPEWRVPMMHLAPEVYSSFELPLSHTQTTACELPVTAVQRLQPSACGPSCMCPTFEIYTSCGSVIGSYYMFLKECHLSHLRREMSPCFCGYDILSSFGLYELYH